jgi:hypothetical protein
MDMQRTYILIFVFAWSLFAASSTRSEEVSPPNTATPPRLSLVEGQVSFWRTGGQDWTPAQPNTPLAAGDSIYTGWGSNAEFQVGPRAYVRIGEATQLQISSIEPDYVQLRLTAGEASLDLRQLMPGHSVEVDTPNAAFTVEHVGYYRFNIDQRSTTLITRRGGSATLTPSNGQATRINAAEEVVASGTDAPTLETYAAPEVDTWDRWNYNRTDSLLDSMSARYVPAEVYGAADLDHSGTWRTVPEYGPVWVPEAVAPGWAPYSAGHWIYDPVYGWSWVDDARWGWAPYHYGRWVNVNGIWGWAPGPMVARPIYAPALVAWLGGVQISAGVGVGWVALGWGEPLVPWWGPRGYAGVPSWGGWGGPRVVNRTIINTTTVNVTNINVTNITYANTQVHNAVITTSSERFSRGGRDYTRASAEAVRDWHPAERGIEVRPSPASLAPGEGHATRPPQENVERRVVAMRAPHDSSPWLHEAGLNAPERAGPPSQIVVPRGRAPVAEEQTLPRTGNGLEQRVETRSPGEARFPAEARVETFSRPGAAEQHAPPPQSTAQVQRQQVPFEAPKGPEQHANAQPLAEPRNPSINVPAVVERMRPPPPPSFNEWRNQQQSPAPQVREPAAPHSAATPPPPSNALPRGGQGNHSEPATAGSDRHNLPGEPAMKLRPAPAAAGPSQKDGGVTACKGHECR